MQNENFAEGSLLYHQTKLLCAVHGLKAVTSVNDDGNAELQCGCDRGPSLPVTDGRVSLESFSPFCSNTDQRLGSRLFPASIGSLKSVQRLWGRNAA